MNFSPLIFLVMLLSLNRQAFAQDNLPPPKPSKFLLKGSVEHSERLDPVPASEMPGKLFDPLFKGVVGKTKSQQFLVPNWLAGEWERTQSYEVSRVSLPSNTAVTPAGRSVARVTDRFGTYRDRQGRIWQVFDPKKAVGQVDRGGSIDYHRVGSFELAVVGINSAIVEVTACHVVVNKKTNRIVSTYQDEELNKYMFITDGQVRTDGSVKVFDAHGKPMFLTKLVSTESRVAPFKR